MQKYNDKEKEGEHISHILLKTKYTQKISFEFNETL